jgi:hypothetical protein
MGYYSRLLPQLVKTWREAFNVPFAALIVQLAAYGSPDVLPALRSADALPILREAQYSVLALPTTAVAIAADIGNVVNSSGAPPYCLHPVWYVGGIHPRNKTQVGLRLALKLAAIEGILPPDTVATGPVASGFSAGGAGVHFTVDAASAPSGALTLVPTEDCMFAAPMPEGSTPADCCQNAVATTGGFPFELLLANGTYVLATATLAPAAVSLAPLDGSVVGPFAGVRYAWQAFPQCALINAQGLPMAPFTHAL